MDRIEATILIKPIEQISSDNCEKCKYVRAHGSAHHCLLHRILESVADYNRDYNTNIFLAQYEIEQVPTQCSKCGRDLNGYKGPQCRYCEGTAE